MSSNSGDPLERADQFKRLFIDPAVEAMGDRIQAQLEPIVAGQKHILEKLNEQKVKDAEQDRRLDNLEKSHTKALIGYGVFATGISVVLAACWDWIKGRLRIFHLLLLMLLAGCQGQEDAVIVVALDNDKLNGSGFVLTDGVVVTAAHVASSPGLVAVIDNDLKLPTSVASLDRTSDTARLDAPVRGHARVRPPVHGERVRLVGYLLSADGTFVLVESWGTVISGRFIIGDLHQFFVQGAAGPGMSGGPIIAMDGAVVGIILGTWGCDTMVRAGFLETQ